ncbi:MULTISPECIES: galactokinase [unclassified Modestobacter]|uniref:galactokinase n=1 Tax=unclassified Modestobacter TaxID=2643866 RepID=UPI0022AA5A21|nr:MULTISPECIES: galactokinase [unclassified Modestobacter]MCZ2823888.1 galactokinase [Modestobacter sp. VKM Ac-2981]MCZ2852133.1 galactokinase [Modestobacter sp. VKM Ac-2982]
MTAQEQGDLAVAELRATWGSDPDGVWAAPGRVNLIGEHVDYTGGRCLPFALTRVTAAAVRRRDDDRVRISSTDPDAAPFEGTLADLGPGDVSGWVAYAAGTLWSLQQAGVELPGLDLAVSSDVPLGAGLSSSASLEAAVALSAAELAGRADDRELRHLLIQAAIRAENEVVGAGTGGMDQTVALLAEEGSALLIHTRDSRTEPVQLGLAEAGLELMVIDTRVSHTLADGQYAQRRADCEEAARQLGLEWLSDATPADVARLGDPRLQARTRHVVTENQRVDEVVELVRAGRVAEIGPLLDGSHTSLRDDYEVSAVELDVVVAAARAAGALGARMVGGGFGGSAIALIRSTDAQAVGDAVTAACRERDLTVPGILTVTSGPAARRLS